MIVHYPINIFQLATRQPPQVWWEYAKLSILDGLKTQWEIAIAWILFASLPKVQREAQLSGSHSPVKHKQEVLSVKTQAELTGFLGDEGRL